MTKEILRFHSPQDSELYKLRGGKLCYVTRAGLADLDTSRVSECILGPDQFLWSHMALDSGGFSPDPDTFLFASSTILPLENIVFLPPTYNDHTQDWTQIWVLREKLAHLFDAVPSLRTIRAELNSIAPPQGATRWSAGGTYSGFWDGSRITYKPKSSPTTPTVQASDDRDTLDGFRMIPRAPSFDRGKRRPHALVLGLSAATLCLGIPWLDSISMMFSAPPPKPAVFDNRIAIEPVLDQITPIVSGMELQEISISAGTGALTLGLGPDRSWPRGQIDDLSGFCAKQGCQIMGPTPPTAPTITLRGLK